MYSFYACNQFIIYKRYICLFALKKNKIDVFLHTINNKMEAHNGNEYTRLNIKNCIPYSVIGSGKCFKCT